jgi:hypothetical protein
LPLVAVFAILGSLLIPFTPVGLWAAIAGLAVGIGYAVAVSIAAHPSREEEQPLRYRALVAGMYLTQPIVRAWGRVFTRKEREKPSPVQAGEGWTGDRERWLLHLENGLRERGLGVRIGGTHDRWDLDTSLGFLVSARITVAVVWGWTPVKRRTLRVRLPAISGIAGLAPAAILGVPWALPLLGGVFALSAIEAIALRRVTNSALDSTTPGPEAIDA